MARYMVMVSGERALQGDTALIQNGQLRLGVLSQQDLAENTHSLQSRIDDGLAQLAEQGCYLTDITWLPLEYDKEEHLYRYRLNMELTGSGHMVLTLEAYRISDQFVYIPGTGNAYGDKALTEALQVLVELKENDS